MLPGRTAGEGRDNRTFSDIACGEGEYGEGDVKRLSTWRHQRFDKCLPLACLSFLWSRLSSVMVCVLSVKCAAHTVFFHIFVNV